MIWSIGIVCLVIAFSVCCIVRREMAYNRNYHLIFGTEDEPGVVRRNVATLKALTKRKDWSEQYASWTLNQEALYAEIATGDHRRGAHFWNPPRTFDPTAFEWKAPPPESITCEHCGAPKEVALGMCTQCFRYPLAQMPDVVPWRPETIASEDES